MTRRRRDSMKKIISILLAVILTLSMMPTIAFASPTEACDGYILGEFNGSPACVDANGNLHICDKNFPESRFRGFIAKEYDGNGDNLLEPATVAAIYDMECSDNYYTNLSGIEYFTALMRLDCAENQITDLDISKLSNLGKLYCDSNLLTSLNTSQNTELKSFTCEGNSLTSLDISENKELKYFSCNANKLTSLDVSNNKNLTTLECAYNQISTLVVTNNDLLEELSCSNNAIETLDVTNNQKLEDLECSFNKLKELNLTFNKELGDVYLNANEIDAIDISNNELLEILDCSYNHLKSIDTSNNKELVALTCVGNDLSSLDVSTNSKLGYLYCNANNLTSLDVSGNLGLGILDCRDNKITSLDVSKNVELQELYCSNNNLEKLILGDKKAFKRLECINNRLKILELGTSDYFPTVTCYHQNISDIAYSKDGNTYTVDLGSIIGSANINYIKSVSAKNKSGASLAAAFDRKTGKVLFTEEPSTVTYVYNVRYNSIDTSSMDVTLIMKKPVNTGHTEDHKTITTLTRATQSEDGEIVIYCPVCNKVLSKKVIPCVSSTKLAVSSTAYNGKAKLPAVTCKDRKGKVLKVGTDFTVDYSAFKPVVGQYAIKVTFKGNYVGKKTLTYTIKPVATSFSQISAGSKKFTVKWSKKTTQVTGYEVQYSKSAKFSSAKTVTIGKNTTTSATITKLTGKCKYYVRVRTYKSVKVGSKSMKLYSDWSGVKSITTKK